MSKLASLPLILRREAFGGIVFDPFDGSLLELDHDGFAVAHKLFSGWGFFFDADKRAFMRELKQKLNYSRHREVHIIDKEPWTSKGSTPSLSAPTLVDFQITSQCNMGCPHCYASATVNGSHVPWEDIVMVVENLHECGVCQLAIGGGEPLLHPQIIDLLKLCHAKNIVPNLTTGGMEFTDENLAAIKNYCGAVGLSLEGVGEHYDKWRSWGFDNYQKALARMHAAGIPTVIQVTLSAENLFDLDDIIDFCLQHPYLYGVIFLAYKNVGRGTKAADGLGTIPADTVSQILKRTFERLSPHMRVGYDCCMTPGIAGVEAAHDFVDINNLEGCSATRGSVGISTELEVIPCTFTWEYPLGNLREHSLREIWEGRASESFRSRIAAKATWNNACSGCGKQSHCMGGCPVMPLINCHNDHLAEHQFPSPAAAQAEQGGW